MPAINPRIAVYLPKHVAKTVQRCASLRGISRSALVCEILTEAQPVLDRVSNLLDLAARTDRTALKQWADTLGDEQDRLEKDATAVLADANATLDRAESLMRRSGKRRRSRRPRTPGQ